MECEWVENADRMLYAACALLRGADPSVLLTREHGHYLQDMACMLVRAARQRIRVAALVDAMKDDRRRAVYLGGPVAERAGAEWKSHARDVLGLRGVTAVDPAGMDQSLPAADKVGECRRMIAGCGAILVGDLRSDGQNVGTYMEIECGMWMGIPCFVVWDDERMGRATTPTWLIQDHISLVGSVDDAIEAVSTLLLQPA